MRSWSWWANEERLVFWEVFHGNRIGSVRNEMFGSFHDDGLTDSL